jgi:predicted nucleic acid-binding protein
LDASVAIAWCFPDENVEYAERILDRLKTHVALVPSLWRIELANSFLVGERRNRCTRADVVAWTSFLDSLPIEMDEETGMRALSDVLDVARSFGLAVYDAAYLELAIRLGIPLATLDERLKQTLAHAGISEFS